MVLNISNNLNFGSSSSTPINFYSPNLHLVNNFDKTKDMAQNARTKVSGFDWEIVKEQWNELLK